MQNTFKILLFILAISMATSAFAASGTRQAMKTSASAMKAQGERIKVVTENIANSETTGISPDEEPYRRKTIFFENVKDKKSGATLLKVRKIDTDNDPFKMEYNPTHPAADAQGYVRQPNVDRSLESIDLQDAQRSYEANVSAIEASRNMNDRALDLLR